MTSMTPFVTLEEVVRLAQTEFLYTIELPNRQ
jgi:hypothetical protein